MDFRKTKYRLKRLLRIEELKLLMDVATCNLRCKMCPRGGPVKLINDCVDTMSLDLFKEVIDKFISENVKIKELEIGNWGDPLLNPSLSEMIQYIKKNWPPSYSGKRGTIGISTNLNYLQNAKELVSCGVDRIRVSVSGMSQNIYGINHIGGDIEKVIKNILILVETRESLNLRNVSLGIGFHDLLYNKKDAETAKAFCLRHGLFFTPIPMYISSVEENIMFHRRKAEMAKFYNSFIDTEAEVRVMKKKNKLEKCQFRRSTITLDQKARICRCCGVYETTHLIGSLFDYKIREIPKIHSEICNVCVNTPISWR